MGEIIGKIEGLKREVDHLYYVKFDDSGCCVYKAKLMRGGDKKKNKVK